MAAGPCINRHSLLWLLLFFIFKHWLMPTTHEIICICPCFKANSRREAWAGQMASHWTSHTMKVTLKSHIRQPLFLQSLDPIWAYSLNADYLNQIQIRSSSLKTTASLVLISSKVLKSFPIPPPWTWRLFGSGVEFIHGLKLVQIAMYGDENSVSKDLWKCPTLFLASLPVSHQAHFCNTLCNLILEPIWRKSRKMMGNWAKITGRLWGILFCLFWDLWKSMAKISSLENSDSVITEILRNTEV